MSDITPEVQDQLIARAQTRQAIVSEEINLSGINPDKNSGKKSLKEAFCEMFSFCDTENRPPPSEILARGERIKRHLILNHGFHEDDLAEGKSIQLKLDKAFLRMLLRNGNYVNRSPIFADFKTYFEDVKRGIWNFIHHDGKRLVLSFYGFQILSAQHRVAVMLLAMELGIIPEGWNVTIEFAEPLLWAQKAGKTMPSKDKLKIINSIQGFRHEAPALSDIEINTLRNINSQLNHFRTGRSSNVGNQMSEEQLMGEFTHPIRRFFEIMRQPGMPSIKPASKEFQALATVFCRKDIRSFLDQLRDPNSYATSVRNALMFEGFGQAGHNSLHYVVAIYEQATRLDGTIKDYKLVPRDRRPTKEIKKNVYIFSDYTLIEV